MPVIDAFFRHVAQAIVDGDRLRHAADQTDAVAPNTYRVGTVVQITATPAAFGTTEECRPACAE